MPGGLGRKPARKALACEAGGAGLAVAGEMTKYDDNYVDKNKYM